MQSSTYTLGPVQKDGRRYVDERHTDAYGNVLPFSYLADAGANYAANLAAHAALLDTQQADAEFEAVLNGA